ncbi:alanine--glyoxylate aminotransferase-like [Saccoglossus kowalevskii]|uniref:Serine--pyruvate aminotransferase, mitochondrial-like isoform X1 n=1 Tax=Saccoglossus kowalevskii TaxID=10224 RepID=A0ABM0GUC5_SACKO|nr:PREDICTED: serine--pyruvate aminotransferase, mitochondrial-like isoform X1 [Saccoglossus kowalevskii]
MLPGLLRRTVSLRSNLRTALQFQQVKNTTSCRNLSTVCCIVGTTFDPSFTPINQKPKRTMATYSITPPSQELLKPIHVPPKTLMGPGPSNASDRVLKASALPILGHLHPEFCKVMDDIKAGLQYAFQTKNPVTFAISGTGHAGMEAALMNIIERGEVFMSAVKGLWGERAADLADRLGADVRRISKPLGEVFSLDDIEKGLKEHKPSALYLCHSESSSGILQPLEGMGPLCKKYNCILIVDTVASLGGVPFFLDELDIDLVYSGSQKVLSAPPGTAPITFGPRAIEKIKNRKTRVPSFYFDFEGLANYWGCDEGPRRYHHTAPINSMYALRESLAFLAEEGLEKFWARHKECAELLYKGVEDMGLKMLVPNKDCRLPCVNTVCVPEGVDWKAVTVYVMSKYSIEISGGLGASAGKVWRIGLMGENATKENVERVLKALKEGIESVKAGGK